MKKALIIGGSGGLSSVVAKTLLSRDSVYDSLHKKTPQTEDGIFIEHDSDSGAIKYGYNKRQMELAFLGYV